MQQQANKDEEEGLLEAAEGLLGVQQQEEEGLDGVHKRLRCDKRLKNKRRLQGVERKTGCHPKEANPKKASVCET
jgi:hypothetical protein